ncbi:hypothetical protein DOK67_0002532 [Enterococcus sp. DIV0212c]|uniref:WxL domain-containing protein n=1 Tax=Enterococcus sp. DIV0212c TaxID=2230867 RepID=UPI001A9C0B47|nr:WxL domain-containing protein [Enterococcus sp. DIV0212c]MBO1353538.1 WxL domain-containing protein [Enterococcus sp. DIV0212c]
MKKNNTLATTGLVTFAALLLGTPAAFAETITEGEATPPMTIQNKPLSEAEISFSQDATKPTTPVGPGGEDIIGKKPEETGMVGPLTIDYITKINFGNQKVNGNTTTYHAKLAQITLANDKSVKDVPNYVQITDNRGSNAGWNLQVKQNHQFQAKDENGKVTSELKGASLAFNNPVLKSSEKGADLAPNGLGHTFVPGEAAVSIVDANVGKGMGTWVYSLGDTNEQGAKSVSLTVPGDIAKQSGVAYKTELEWTLIDAPAKSE